MALSNFAPESGGKAAFRIAAATIRRRVISARDRQRERFAYEGIFSNAAMTPRLIRTYCRIDGESESMLERAMVRLGYRRARTTES